MVTGVGCSPLLWPIFTVIVNRNWSPGGHFRVLLRDRLNTGHVERAASIHSHILVYKTVVKSFQCNKLGTKTTSNSPKYSMTSFLVTSQIGSSSDDDIRLTCSTWYGMAGISRSTSISVFSTSTSRRSTRIQLLELDELLELESEPGLFIGRKWFDFTQIV